MGNEALCRVVVDGTSAEAKVLLETDELIVRGAMKLRVPLREVTSAEARDGVLHLRWNDHQGSFAVGNDAAKWAEKIRNPKSVIDKLGVKPGQRITIAGDLGGFAGELQQRGADVSTKPRKESDAIFFAASSRADLAKLGKLKESLAPAGALWVIRPKGSDAISEAEVREAGLAAGLVDVKVVRFSDTLTAEKFCFRRANRG